MKQGSWITVHKAKISLLFPKNNKYKYIYINLTGGRTRDSSLKKQFTRLKMVGTNTLKKMERRTSRTPFGAHHFFGRGDVGKLCSLSYSTSRVGACLVMMKSDPFKG